MKRLLAVLIVLVLMPSLARALPPCQNERYHNCYGTYTFDGGDKYVGEVRDGAPHGHGTLTNANGDKYVGEWRDAKPNGQGTLTYAGGHKYVGEWRDAKQHGQGTFTWADGSKYVGEHRNGEKHGQGIYTFGPSSKHAGDKHVGEYRDGKRNGQGTFTFANGDKYVGEYKDDVFHGHGTYTFADGRKYVGEYRNGKQHGQGTRYLADGRVYQEGMFENGEFKYAQKVSPTEKNSTQSSKNLTRKQARKDPSSLPPCPADQNESYHNCYGTYTDTDGSKYVGEWKDDEYQGHGNIIYPNGDKYVGKFRNDKLHGQGTFTFADGRVREGVWEYGKFQYARKVTSPVTAKKPPSPSPSRTFALPECEGSPITGSISEVRTWTNCEGTHIFANGNQYVGEWRDGKPHGHVTVTFARGSKFVGEFRNGKPNGRGTYTSASGNKYIGEHRDGKRHGHFTVTYPNGNKYVGEYRDDKRHGQGTFTYADGRIKEGIWENGKFKYAQKVSPTQRQPTQSSSDFPLEKAEKSGKSSTYVQAIRDCLTNKAFFLAFCEVSIPKSALLEIEPLAEQGDAEAQFSLGLLHYKGVVVTQDDKAAAKWFTLAAEQGYAIAQSRLGEMYRKGLGVTQNDKTALKWHRLAAEQGYADAQFYLGMMYRNGLGVTQNDKTALKWYRLAADQGDAYAQREAEILQKKIAEARTSPPPPKARADYQAGLDAYHTGDYATALREFKPLAKQGDANAQYGLGRMYRIGLGVTQNYETTLKLYRLAAEQGHAEAQFNLGVMYANGQGVPEDYKTAVKWYTLAAKQGNPYARINLEILQKKIAEAKDTPPKPKNLSLEMAENKCAELGFTKGTEKYGDCVMKLLN